MESCNVTIFLRFDMWSNALQDQIFIAIFIAPLSFGVVGKVSSHVFGGGPLVFYE